MISSPKHHRTAAQRFMSVCVLAAALLTGCASVYVDTATKLVPVADLKIPVDPKPVQLVFEFQTKGVPNARATEYLKEAVTQQVKDSGLFTTVEATPSKAMLKIILNNVPLTEDAASKGFVTGLTFGLAGSAVTDGYICTATYLPVDQTTPIVTTAKHAIHTTLGNANPPTGVQKAESIDAAVRTMTKEVVSNALKDLSYNASFK